MTVAAAQTLVGCKTQPHIILSPQKVASIFLPLESGWPCDLHWPKLQKQMPHKQRAYKRLNFGVCPPAALGPLVCFVHESSLATWRTRDPGLREASVFLTTPGKAILSCDPGQPTN